MAKNHSYNLTQTSRIKQALMFDHINEWCIRSYLNDCDKDPTPSNIESYFYNKDGTHGLETELILRLMIHQGYLIQIINKYDPEIVDSFDYTNKGLALYFNGGMAAKIKAKGRKKWLIILAQIATSIAGLFYLLEILKELHKMMCH